MPFNLMQLAAMYLHYHQLHLNLAALCRKSLLLGFTSVQTHSVFESELLIDPVSSAFILHSLQMKR